LLKRLKTTIYQIIAIIKYQIFLKIKYKSINYIKKIIKKILIFLILKFYYLKILRIFFEYLFYIYYLFLFKKELKNKKINFPKRNRFIFAIGTLLDGGAETQILNIILFLKKKFKIRLIIILDDIKNISKKKKKIIDNNNIHVIGLNKLKIDQIDNYLKNKNITLPSEKFFFTTDVIKKYYFIFHKLSPEKVITFLDHCNCFAGIAAALQNIRTICCLRSFNPTFFTFYAPYLKAIYKIIINFNNVKFISNSYAGMCDYIYWIQVKKKQVNKFFYIKNLINTELFSQSKKNFFEKKNLFRNFYNFNNKNIIIGSVIKFDYIKRPQQLLKIFNNLAICNKNYKFLIITNMTDRFKFNFESKKYINLNSENFMVLSDDLNIHKFYYLLDYFVLTSKIEGYPNVLVEAQLMNNYVFTYNCGGVLEVLDNRNFTEIKFSKNGHYESQEIHSTISYHNIYGRNLRIRENFLSFYKINETRQIYKKYFYE
jgi:hypothetical protein